MRNIWIATLAFLLIGLLSFVIWFIFYRNEVSTDDAYVGGNRVIINSQIEGSCVAYFADDNQFVEQGDLLVTLDVTNYEILLRLALDELENIVRSIKNLQESIFSLQYQSKMQEMAVEKAQYDYDNRAALVDVLAVSQEEVEHNQITLNIEKYQLESLKSQLAGQQAILGNGPLDQNPQILAQIEKVRLSFANLTRCHIYAPCTGIVALRYIQVGQWVTPRTEMMSVVPIDEMWVDANYKESQLSNLRIGQPTTVRIDEFGSSFIFHGKVQGIQMGTGAAFSLLPAQNATGNWIKIVQRVPVRIELNPEDVRKHPLRIGLSSFVRVDVTDRSGDVLQQLGGFSWKRKTDVIDIDFASINTMIDGIVKENL